MIYRASCSSPGGAAFFAHLDQLAFYICPSRRIISNVEMPAPTLAVFVVLLRAAKKLTDDLDICDD